MGTENAATASAETVTAEPKSDVMEDVKQAVKEAEEKYGETFTKFHETVTDRDEALKWVFDAKGQMDKHFPEGEERDGLIAMCKDLLRGFVSLFSNEEGMETMKTELEKQHGPLGTALYGVFEYLMKDSKELLAKLDAEEAAKEAQQAEPDKAAPAATPISAGEDTDGPTTAPAPVAALPPSLKGLAV